MSSISTGTLDREKKSPSLGLELAGQKMGEFEEGAQMEFEPHSPPAKGLVGAFRKYLNARNRRTKNCEAHGVFTRGRGGGSVHQWLPIQEQSDYIQSVPIHI